MPSIFEVLKAKRQEAQSQKDDLEREIRDIDTALNAIEGSRSVATEAKSEAVGQKPTIPINDGIVVAIEQGARTPLKIKKYLLNRLGIETTTSSISTRLWKLKGTNKVIRDATGWVISPHKDEAPDAATSGASDRGDGAPPSHESQARPNGQLG